MGEIEYNRWSGQVAIAFIRDNPARFATMTGRRVLAWWFGQDSRWIGHLQGLPERLDLFKRAIILVPLPFLLIGALRSRPSGHPGRLLVTILLVYPIPYYFLFVVERYRFPTDPFMIVIATFGAVASFETFRALARTLKADVLTASREHISSIADAERGPKSRLPISSHSSLSARTGSTRAARQAGIALAAIDTATSRPATKLLPEGRRLAAPCSVEMARYGTTKQGALRVNIGSDLYRRQGTPYRAGLSDRETAPFPPAA